MRRLVVCLFLAGLLSSQSPSVELKLPLKPKAIRFAVIGDSGTGLAPQYEVGQQMATYRGAFPFEFVIMLGDNIYGGKTPYDFQRKFEAPYRPLLDEGVKFYASLGNHDDPNECFYKPFNMGGKRFYTFKRDNAEFFALDSNYMSPEQLAWLRTQLANSHATWKICYFHHPLYSHSRFHGADTDLRRLLEPIFEQYGVNIVFGGHEHVYERIKPQNGIEYFVLGSSGQLRSHDLKHSVETAKGFDADQTFVLVEVDGDECFFQAISRTGATVDSGVIEKHAKSSAIPAGQVSATQDRQRAW